MFKFNNKTTERRSTAFIVNFEHALYPFQLLLLLTLNK